VKRKLGLFLLAVIVAVTLGATLVVSATMYRLVSAKQAQEIHDIEASLSERFTIFEVMLQSQHDRIAAHMAQVLPLIAREIEGLAIRPDKLTAGQMDELTRKYDVERIYFIDRAYRIFQTNLPTDLDLQFPTNGFTKFLDTVFGRDRVMSIGIDLSTKTGALNTYSYFGPRAEDYIIETSTELARSLAEGDFGWMSRYFFKDLFLDAVTSNEYVKDVDLYLVNDAAAWSLLHAGTQLDPAIVSRVAADGRYRVKGADGKLITIYSVDNSNATVDRQTELVKRLVIRKITYDASLARDAAINVLIGSLAVLVLALPLVFWLASYLLQKQLLNPLFRLRTEARAIADGDLERRLGDTNRRDEIGNLATSFATMRDAVRRTILDLRRPTPPSSASCRGHCSPSWASPPSSRSGSATTGASP
jgi:HAMP domain-containing protein